MSFEVKIITPEDIFFQGRSTSLTAPGALGYFGVLTGHAPLVTPLTQGEVKVRVEGGGEKRFGIEGGFLEVAKDEVLILVEKIAEASAAPSGEV